MFSPSVMALTGHSGSQAPQLMHSSLIRCGILSSWDPITAAERIAEAI
jgi:hypothetical protein